jgi:hypothetical protein
MLGGVSWRTEVKVATDFGNAERALGMPTAGAGLAEVTCEVPGEVGHERTQGG